MMMVMVLLLVIVMEYIGKDGIDGNDSSHHSGSLSETGSQCYHPTLLVPVPTVCAMSFGA